MAIRTIQEAEAALLPYVPLVAQLTGKGTTLERVIPLMELAGNPQDRLKTVHIAGTSGKTSTSYYITELLRASGKTVGLTVSPHVDSITERVQINGQPLSDAEFCRELETFLAIVERAAQPPSYFELLYAFTLWIFERRAVEYAVIETGMGGLFDATNVAKRADKVCVITDIGFDHTHILGNTLPEITAQKIGIAHAGNVVLMYEQAADIMQVVEQYVRQVGAEVRPTTQDAEQTANDVDISRLPLYQQRNWLLARYAYKYLQNRDGLPNLTSQVLQDTLTIQVPGRMDVRQIKGKTIVMDGAHNEQKMTTFITSFQHLYPGVKPAVVLALKEGKEYQKVLPLLATFAARVYLTTFQTSQDLPARSIEPELLTKHLQAYPDLPVQCFSDQRAAFTALLASPETVGVITGSFYLLSQLRKNERIIA
jgi:dihydrofolate synthase/folylpolyglutamate synthase